MLFSCVPIEFASCTALLCSALQPAAAIATGALPAPAVTHGTSALFSTASTARALSSLASESSAGCTLASGTLPSTAPHAAGKRPASLHHAKPSTCAHPTQPLSARPRGTPAAPSSLHPARRSRGALAPRLFIQASMRYCPFSSPIM